MYRVCIPTAPCFPRLYAPFPYACVRVCVCVMPKHVQNTLAFAITPRPNTGQVLVRGAKRRKHGVPVFGQAGVCAQHVPPAPPCASTLKVRKRTIRRAPVLRQGSAHKRTPKGAVRENTVRRAPMLGHCTTQCLRKGGRGVPRALWVPNCPHRGHKDMSPKGPLRARFKEE